MRARRLDNKTWLVARLLIGWLFMHEQLRITIGERLHSQLKTALKAHAIREHWVDDLPIVLLGIRLSFKPAVNACAAKPVYGSTLRLPGEFLEQTTSPGDVDDLLHRLHPRVRSQQPQLPPASNATSFIDPRLKTCTHVFLRCDRVRRPLQLPYDGPCQVLSGGDKTFMILLTGREEPVAVDRPKAAAVETTQPPISN